LRCFCSKFRESYTPPDICIRVNDTGDAWYTKVLDNGQAFIADIKDTGEASCFATKRMDPRN
jgi:hypothetical protein